MVVLLMLKQTKQSRNSYFSWPLSSSDDWMTRWREKGFCIESCTRRTCLIWRASGRFIDVFLLVLIFFFFLLWKIDYPLIVEQTLGCRASFFWQKNGFFFFLNYYCYYFSFEIQLSSFCVMQRTDSQIIPATCPLDLSVIFVFAQFFVTLFSCLAIYLISSLSFVRFSFPRTR